MQKKKTSREKQLRRLVTSSVVNLVQTCVCVRVRVPVYNWTLQQVEDWLLVSVELPQYADSFRRHQLDGKALPR